MGLTVGSTVGSEKGLEVGLGVGDTGLNEGLGVLIADGTEGEFEFALSLGSAVGVGSVSEDGAEEINTGGSASGRAEGLILS